MNRSSRLDRQLRIEGWDQTALDRARIGVVGDDDLLASFFILSASALGINSLIAVAPTPNRILMETAVRVNPLFSLLHVEGFYTHTILDDLFRGCDVIVDLSHYGLANKLLLEKGFQEKLPVVRGFCREEDGRQGLRVFTYLRGREWHELDRIVCSNSLPAPHFDDGALDIITAGIVLEEVKGLLMRRKVSDALITFERTALGPCDRAPRALVAGAGALGTFVALGLIYSGHRHCTFIDPDAVEATNLNRQVLFYDALGQSKAETLSQRMNDLFDMKSSARVAYFGRDMDLSEFDVVFDCVDNFESRIELSESCRDQGKILISGGTSANAGQVIVYNPATEGPTPAELLGLYEIVSTRGFDAPVRKRASCTYRPDPSVIMTNEITAGFMVDSFRRLLDGQDVPNLFYDSASSVRI